MGGGATGPAICRVCTLCAYRNILLVHRGTKRSRQLLPSIVVVSDHQFWIMMYACIYNACTTVTNMDKTLNLLLP